ncbi:MAG: hypothetical protein M3Z75_28000 [Actinomycetota bacterium]|nr:hypothetical protein [Actinomycetota bacterium]
MPSPDSSALNDGELVIPGHDGRPLITARRDGDHVTVAAHTRYLGRAARISPAQALDLAAALTHLAAMGEAVPDPGEPADE